MKPVLTPKEANDLMRDAAIEGQGQSAICKVFALPFFGWLRNILPLADESIKKWEERQ